MDGDEAVQLVLNLLDHQSGAGTYDRNAGEVVGMVGLGDGEAFDVVAAPRKQTDHAGKDARLVVDKYGKGVCFNNGVLGANPVNTLRA